MYVPFHCYHKLEPKDKFLILSSCGLYKYFINEEAISGVQILKSAFLGPILLNILPKCFSVLLRKLVGPYEVYSRHNLCASL
ncbi:Phosphoprotein phosphatase [Handroanthus impetiginosus]|uniref:Phosphoprotein phosphatase n=1 Tax=Handroanthus impetiginosus TaxID=429701 RepID=A0A2G9G9U3_9LAMI|nr:Phosphoprotein phosphatase [Handroanthus impetiginosus]